jgi:hypothetical protein
MNPGHKRCEKELEKTQVNFELGPGGVLEDEAVDVGSDAPAQSAEGVVGCLQRLRLPGEKRPCRQPRRRSRAAPDPMKTPGQDVGSTASVRSRRALSLVLVDGNYAAKVERFKALQKTDAPSASVFW